MTKRLIESALSKLAIQEFLSNATEALTIAESKAIITAYGSIDAAWQSAKPRTHYTLNCSDAHGDSYGDRPRRM